MGRPPKKGLSYFPRDTDYYNDLKIMDLMNEYGPLGLVIYDIVITMVYKEGYYLEVSLDKVAAYVTRIVGNRWIKDRNLVLQVIQYCSDIGLLHDALLKQSVITSAGIQRRYQEVTVRNKVIKDKYWLLDTDGQVPLNVPENQVSVTETPVFDTETRENVEVSTQNEIKENKSKVNKTYSSVIAEYTSNSDLRTALQNFVAMRNKMKGFTLNALELGLNKLDKLATGDLSKIEIVNQSIERSWKGFFPIKQKSPFTSRRQDVLPDYYQQMKSGSEKETAEETDFDREEFEEIRRQLREQEEKK